MSAKRRGISVEVREKIGQLIADVKSKDITVQLQYFDNSNNNSHLAAFFHDNLGRLVPEG